MAEEIKRVTDLDEVLSIQVNDTDLIYLIDDVSSVPTSKKMTVAEAKKVFAELQAGHAGVVGEVEIIDNGDGTLTIASYYVNFFTNGELIQKLLTPKTLTAIANTTNYLVANYNNGSAEFQLITNESLIDQQEIIRVGEIYRSSSSPMSQHIQESALSANIEVSQINRRIQETDRYGFSSGALKTIQVNPSLQISINGGIVWAGSERYEIPDTTELTRSFMITHVAGNYEVSTSLDPKINNTQYDNLNDMVSLSTGKWTVNYLYRGIENQDHIYIVMGNAEHDTAELASAQSSAPPVPEIISSHAVLVGRVIVQKDATSGFVVESAFDANFSLANSISIHNSLGNIQGGVENERYHLSTSELSLLQSVGTDLEFVEYTENYTNLGSLSGSQTILLSNGQIQQITASASTLTINMPTPEAGKSFVLIVNPSIYTVAWSGVFWLNTSTSSTAADIISSKKNVLTFFSDGTNWYGNLVGVEG